MNKFTRPSAGALIAICLFFIAPQTQAQKSKIKTKELVDYVDPDIGGLGHLLTATRPSVQMPYGMVQCVPISIGGADTYMNTKIAGFPAAGVTLMPTTGVLETSPAQYASDFDRDFEVVTPYYGSDVLENYDVTAEYTAARRAVYYRFSYPQKTDAHLLMTTGAGGEITAVNKTTITGSSNTMGVKIYFYAVFSHPYNSTKNFTAEAVAGGRRGNGRATGTGGTGAGLAVNFSPVIDGKISIKVGTSNISLDEARANLMADIKGDFDATKLTNRTAWNRELGKIAVQGGTEKERTIFYTALYRSMGRPNDMTEVGDKYFSGIDKHVHDAKAHDFYVNDNYWDTHRALHPLQLLLDPKRQVDMINSLTRQYDESGWLPTCPTLTGDRGVMIGHHGTTFITDVYMKGYRDFDVEKAYAGMRKNSLEATVLPWKRGPLTSLDKIYQEKGFFPALAKGETETVPEVYAPEHRQAVAVTLENAVDDWSLAQMAKALHKDDDYTLFMKKAHNYENVFDKRINFMAPKSADGNWVADFDPKRGGGSGGRDYFAEMNSWSYTFQVQQDIPGLINLFGGKEPFIARLDQLFVEPPGTSKWTFLGQFPDMTGLIGQYSSGNEPSASIAYMYNYAGQPWKTQFHVRQIMKIWYDDRLLGIPGDDDGGALSAWYVFSAMGFYPVTPGKPSYDIGSPLFKRVELAVGNGKKFTIIAANASAQNKYIQSAKMNGKVLNGPWFRHADIVGGGTLVLDMGPKPNKTWGVAHD
jgi:predicted alpha-1,2-mannosidase